MQVQTKSFSLNDRPMTLIYQFQMWMIRVGEETYTLKDQQRMCQPLLLLHWIPKPPMDDDDPTPIVRMKESSTHYLHLFAYYSRMAPTMLRELLEILDKCGCLEEEAVYYLVKQMDETAFSLPSVYAPSIASMTD